MFSYLKKIKEEYIQTKNPGEGFFMWLIKRKANDGIIKLKPSTITHLLKKIAIYTYD